MKFIRSALWLVSSATIVVLCHIDLLGVGPSSAFAQGAPGVATPGAAAPGLLDILGKMLPMFAVVFFIFYLMVLKPQQQKLKAQQDLISSLKRGDSVITSGGIMGKVAGVEKDFVLLEVANNVKISVEVNHVTKRFEKQKSEKEKAAASA